MTLEEIKAAYPGAAAAVEYSETKAPPHVWAMARAAGFNPQEIADALAESAPNSVPPAVIAAIRHPNFLRYVAAKLGMM